MPDSPFPPEWGLASLDERDLDAVLAGKTADVPVGLRPVVDVLAALRAGPAPAELYGEANAMAEFHALGLGQAGRAAGPAPTMLLEALPPARPAGRPGRQPARHRVRQRGRHSVRSAALRPAALLGAAAAAVIVLAVLVTGNFTSSLRDIAHMASASAGTRSSTGAAGQSSAPRVETSSAGLDTTPPPPATHSAAAPQPAPSEICRAFYSNYGHPAGPSAWATQQSLWEQLTKLAHSDNPFQVYEYCFQYVKDLFPYAQAPGQNQAPLGPPHPVPGNQGNGLGQQAGAPANSLPGSGGGTVTSGQASNGQASSGQGGAPGSGSNP
jgi:hypothetical protein